MIGVKLPKNQRMKVMVINPPRVDGYPVVREERFEHKETDSVYPPLSHLYTAAYLEKHGFDVKVIDANGFDLTIEEVEDHLLNFKPKVVYARLGFDTHMKDLETLKMVKKHGMLAVTRNRIISEVPEIKRQLLGHGYIDIFINNDPEQVVLEICENVRDKKPIDNIRGTTHYNSDTREIKENEPIEKVINFDGLPSPAYHLLPSIEPYFSGVLLPKPFVMIQTSNGCPFACTFCAYNRAEYKARTPSKVAEELEYIKKNFGIKSFVVFDDMFTLYKDRAKDICNEIIKRNLDLKWTCCTRVNSVDDELIGLMKQAGCVEVAFGIESGSDEILRTVKKGINKSMIMQALDICKKHSMKFYCMIILGLPGDNEETFRETLEFVKQVAPFYTQFGFSVPFPNTENYNYYKEKSLLLTEDWTKYNTLQREPLVRTEALTPERLIEMKKTAYKETSLHPMNILKGAITSIKQRRSWEANVRAAKLLASKIFNKDRLLR